jgi:hypothetical protein
MRAILGRRFGIVVVLAATISGAAAQSVSPPRSSAEDTAALKADIKADVATARAQEKSVAATRQQIQAIRAALRAKLAALHH